MSKCTKKYLLFLSFLTGVGVIAGGSNITHALTYQDTVDVQFTFNPTVSINVSGDLIIPNLTPGSALDSNIITVRAGSNDANGYTLYSTVGSSTTNYTDLRIDSSNTTNVFTNLSSSKASLENFDDNTWGYSYCSTTNDCDTNTNWVSGNAGSTVAGYNGLPLYNASNNATGVILANTTSHSETELKFKIGAKAASTQAAGAYTNTINFIGVAKVITTTYTLSYVDNSGEATNMPASATTGATTTGAFNITDTAPTRANYIFKGWCTATTNDDTCSGNIVKPGGLYVIGSNSTTFNSSVYAMWGDNTPGLQCPADKNCMQTVDSTTLATLMPNTGSTTTLYDIRDGNEYTVAKLADGYYWMTENLRLGKSGGEIIALTDADSDLPTGTTFDLKASGMGSTQPDATNGDCNVGDWHPSHTKQYLDVSHLCINTITPSYGTYYNWYTAVAGTAGYDNINSEALGSICPKGWKLPPFSGEGSYYNLLFTKMGLSSNDASSTTMQQPPTSFLLSGLAYGTGLGSQGTDGLYWSSTADNNTRAYYLYFLSSDVSPREAIDKGIGLSVRCLAR